MRSVERASAALWLIAARGRSGLPHAGHLAEQGQRRYLQRGLRRPELRGRVPVYVRPKQPPHYREHHDNRGHVVPDDQRDPSPRHARAHCLLKRKFPVVSIIRPTSNVTTLITQSRDASCNSAGAGVSPTQQRGDQQRNTLATTATVTRLIRPRPSHRARRWRLRWWADIRGTSTTDTNASRKALGPKVRDPTNFLSPRPETEPQSTRTNSSHVPLL